MVTPSSSNGPDERSAATAPALAVVTHNSLAYLHRFLLGHVAVAEALNSVLVVVDNASRDGTREHLEGLASSRSSLIVALNSRNGGYASAVNRAFALTGQRDVFVVNPDVQLDEVESVQALMAISRSEPEVGVVGPRLVYADGITQESVRRFPSVLAMGGHASFLRHLPAARRASGHYLSIPDGDGPVEVDWATGAAMLIRRQAYVDVGGFDDGFFLYLEDCDFCLRCARAGWRTVYAPGVTLRHLHPRASHPRAGSVLTSRARRAHIVSMWRFFRKYPRLAVG